MVGIVKAHLPSSSLSANGVWITIGGLLKLDMWVNRRRWSCDVRHSIERGYRARWTGTVTIRAYGSVFAGQYSTMTCPRRRPPLHQLSAVSGTRAQPRPNAGVETLPVGYGARSTQRTLFITFFVSLPARQAL